MFKISKDDLYYSNFHERKLLIFQSLNQQKSLCYTKFDSQYNEVTVRAGVATGAVARGGVFRSMTPRLGPILRVATIYDWQDILAHLNAVLDPRLRNNEIIHDL